ncbi:MAG: tetratricopeptide repeat protein, partial [Carnobacterium sp.]
YYYQESLELNPDNETVQLALINLYLKQERFSEAVVKIETALENEEADAQFYWSLALAQEGLENYAKAAEAYQTAYPSFTRNKDFLKAYALFLREEGALELTKEVIEKYLEIESSDEEMIAILDEINSDI